MMRDNKNQVPLDHYRIQYAAIEPEDISSRCNLPFDSHSSAFSLKILNQPMFAGWPRFSMVPQNAADCPSPLYGPSAQILMLRYLTFGHYAPAGPRFLSYRELPWGDVYDSNFQGRCIKKLAFIFGQRLEDFARACERIGGTRLEMGDLSYELPFFSELKIRLILWAGDEEFPPTSQFLFSDNTALAFSAEDLAVIGDLVIATLKAPAICD